MKANDLSKHVIQMASKYENIQIYGGTVSAGKTSKSIERSLELLKEEKRVLFLTAEEAPLTLYKKFLEYAKKLSSESSECAKNTFPVDEYSKENLVITELTIGMSFNEELKFAPIINYDIIRRQIKEFNPELVVIDHFLGSEEEIKRFSRILKENNARGLITRQLNREMKFRD